MIDLAYAVHNSVHTKLASTIAYNLGELNYSSPTDEQLFSLLKKCDSTVEMAHSINEYYVSLLKEALLKYAGTCRAAVEKLLNVEYWKHEGDPSGDRCIICFLHYMFENPTSQDIKTFCTYMSYYNLNLHLCGLNGHTTFSVTLPQRAINKLIEEKLDRYMCPLMFRNDEKNSQPTIKGYLLDVGLMRQHDSVTKNRFGYFQKTLELIRTHNRFILNTEDFLPDYLIINLTEE